MTSPVHKLLVLCCALYLSGAHWCVLQMTAWTGMLVARSQHASMVEAVETTFDGQHPCRLCHAIDAGQKNEKKQDRDVPMLKTLHDAKFVVESEISIPAAIVGDLKWPAWSEDGEARADAPAIPPPRA